MVRQGRDFVPITSTDEKYELEMLQIQEAFKRAIYDTLEIPIYNETNLPDSLVELMKAIRLDLEDDKNT